MKPATRITIGLVSLTLSVLVAGEILGLIPDNNAAILAARKTICESLAVQLSVAAQRNDLRLMETVSNALVAREKSVVSIGARTIDGRLVVATAKHATHWRNYNDDRSTPTHVVGPIYRSDMRWGSVEIRFNPPGSADFLAAITSPPFGLIIYACFSGFFVYGFFLRKTIRELNPSSVIPERVKAAFDVLAEGVLILDEKGLIVLANSAFASSIGTSPDALMGRQAAEMGWIDPRSKARLREFPWTHAKTERKHRLGFAMSLETPGGLRTFMVNGAPILDGNGKSRGALATFDDMTVLEKKNAELSCTLTELQKSQIEINRQNEELKFLATRDPLTSVYNRRSFFELLDTAFKGARHQDQDMCCLMTDIDHFKSINDRFGHAVGDKAIKFLAGVLTEHLRDQDKVCRYGGEEFCALLPDLNIDEANAVAERLRQIIEKDSVGKFAPGVGMTSSIGVSSVRFGAETPAELINQADEALYVAKENGRNRTVRWDQKQQVPTSKQRPAIVIEQNPDRTQNSLIAGATHLIEQRETELNRLQEHVETLQALVDKQRSELVRQHIHDRMTGLPNRILFHDRIKQALERAKRYQTLVAVLTLDIDMFKRINNTLGYKIGDHLLKEVANRIANVLRKTDTVAHFADRLALGTPQFTGIVSRLNGDEFGMLLTDIKNVEYVTWIVKRVIEKLSERIEIGAHEFFITSSIGISLYPNDGGTVDTLLKNSSAARFQAKQYPGRNNYVFYSADINKRVFDQMRLENLLHRAINKQEFIAHYQPRIDLQSGKIDCMEILIRWPHPELGVIPPSEFIPIAEHSGLIIPIGEWVLRTACTQIRAWVDAGLTDARVAVNLSGVQMHDPNLLNTIKRILDEVNLPAEYLEFEITESAIIQNTTSAIKTLNEIRRLGAKIALDDFGTGYSSLSHLREFPVDTLKIDRSFVNDIATNSNNAAIVGALIAMAGKLGIRVTAEGVETEEQLAILRELHCHEIQGFIASRPLPQEAAEALLKQCARSGMRIGKNPPETPELLRASGGT